MAPIAVAPHLRSSATALCRRGHAGRRLPSVPGRDSGQGGNVQDDGHLATARRLGLLVRLERRRQSLP
jgi:hypothetical protein